MYLVDTSVWIDFIRGKPTPAVNQLRCLFEADSIVAINSLIYQEILQGSESEQHFELFKSYLFEQIAKVFPALKLWNSSVNCR